MNTNPNDQKSKHTRYQETINYTDWVDAE